MRKEYFLYIESILNRNSCAMSKSEKGVTLLFEWKWLL